MESPSNKNIPPDAWQAGLKFQILESDDWLKMQNEKLDSNSSFVVVTTEPNQDGYSDGKSITAKDEQFGIEITFTNHSAISDKAIQL